MKKTFILVLFFISLFSVHARGTSQAVLINPYFSLGYVNPSDINDKITTETVGIQNFIDDASTIHWAKNIGAMLGYRFNHRFNVGLLFDYTSAGKFISQESSTAFPIYHPSRNGSLTPLSAKYYEFNTSYSAFSIGPAFYYTIYNSGKLALDAGLGILYAMKVRYLEDITYGNSASDPNLNKAPYLHQYDASGSGFGFLFNVSAAYYLTNYMGIGLDVGYRYLKCGSLTDANGTTVPFEFPNGSTDSPPTNMSVSFSGIYFGLSLKFDINLDSSSDTEKVSSETKDEAKDKWNTEPQAEEFNTSWDSAPVTPVQSGPSIDELKDVKKQIQRKWNAMQESKTPEAQTRAERYRKLYDITNKLEKDWGQFTPDSRRDKLDKIKTILSR
jgi:hypothetical protein